MIIGHFYNPTLEIVGELKKVFPKAKTCVSLHEANAAVIMKCYPKDYMEIIHGVDMIGYRSIPIKKNFEALYGNEHKSLVCWSGTPQLYLETPAARERVC